MSSSRTKKSASDERTIPRFGSIRLHSLTVKQGPKPQGVIMFSVEGIKHDPSYMLFEYAISAQERLLKRQCYVNDNEIRLLVDLSDPNLNPQQYYEELRIIAKAYLDRVEMGAEKLAEHYRETASH